MAAPKSDSRQPDEQAQGADVVLTCRNPERLQHATPELAPVPVSLIAPGFVDTPLSATPLGDRRDLFDAELGLAQTRRNELLVLVQLYPALGTGRRLASVGLLPRL